MIVTLVIDTFGVGNNGTTVSANRFAATLVARGHTVRVVACGTPDETPPPVGLEVFRVPELVVPIASRLAHRQRTHFAAPRRDVLRAAITGADVVHIYQPWALGHAARRVARELGVPAVAAFHIQPENLTYNLGLGWFPPAAHLVYLLLRVMFYGRFTDIHCPSAFIAAQLRRHGYRARLHVISNGVASSFRPGPPRARGDDEPFRVLAVGRFAPEKRQELLIRAARLSRHRDQLELHFAGYGPAEKRLRRLASRLDVPARFGHYSQAELVELIHDSDLYVHTSDVEIEGMSCLEAFASGLVPVISDSRRSATGQFALGPGNLFRAGDPASLARRIDAWLEDPTELRAASKSYVDYARAFSVERSVAAVERVYAQAGRPAAAPPGFGSLGFRAVSAAFYYAVAIPLLWLWTRVVLGARVEGAHHLRRAEGAVTVCNHVHPLDSALVALSLFPRRPIVVSAAMNLENPWYGGLVRLLGGVAVPRTLTDLPLFFTELELQVASGRVIHFFPEGELVPYDTSVRDFKRGAFHLAARTHAPIVPLSIRFTAPHGPRRFLSHRPRMTIVAGEPIPVAMADPRQDERARRQLAYERVRAVSSPGGCAG